MNSTGKALSQADLVRNFILMGLEPEHQTRLYEDHWRPMKSRLVSKVTANILTVLCVII